MRGTFKNWVRKVAGDTKALLNRRPAWESDPVIEAVTRLTEDLNKSYYQDTIAWNSRPKGYTERSVFSILAERMPEPVEETTSWDPQAMSDEAFVSREGAGSIATLRHTAEHKIVETEKDKKAWITAHADAFEDWEVKFQNTINAAFAEPLLKAITWAIEGEMAGVTEAPVKHIQWQDESPTGEINIAEWQHYHKFKEAFA